ncbi:ferredoxin [Constrictibacter sp. MBR-5]|jgi:ferredoxin|uniref:4Fe-4S dicluster domain-containing protein n=1 Tax=Constrictibacter sp. MBR-5 TaxID=3156467 RepID=UPI00339ABCDE
MSAPGAGTVRVIDRTGIARLVEELRGQGYRVLGPTLGDGAIVYDEITTVEDLPAGWTDRQEGGTYRLERRDDEAWFGYASSPHSWKRFLHPPDVRLWQARRRDDGSFDLSEPPPAPKMAFLGVRSCDLQAILVQDRVLRQSEHPDPVYAERRDSAFLVAVNCGDPSAVCFCASMETGPRAQAGFDLALTELIGDGRHEFLLEVGSAAGAAIAERLRDREADEADMARAAAVVAAAAARMGRRLDTGGIKKLLQENQLHPRWEEVAGRCLTCGNCTMVCPTCFCTTVEDTADLTGDVAERWRRWDSCFTLEFSYMNGGSVRNAPAARYRHWLTHKLASWYDQFGTSGCVGCGRCITWCPVGIDITEEVEAIRAHPQPHGSSLG